MSNTREVDSRGFLEEWQLRWMCTVEKSVTILLILSREPSKQLTSLWWQGTTSCKLAFPVWATKVLAVASKWRYGNLLCMCLRTQSMLKVNQKITRSIVRRCLIWDAYTRVKYSCKNFGAKRGGREFARRGHILGNLWYVVTILIFYTT